MNALEVSSLIEAVDADVRHLLFVDLALIDELLDRAHRDKAIHLGECDLKNKTGSHR